MMRSADWCRVWLQWLDEPLTHALDAVELEAMRCALTASIGPGQPMAAHDFRARCLVWRDWELALDLFGCLDAPL